MAKKKKNFIYWFDDGKQEVPSSFKVKCNVTGEMIPIYHKFLQKLVKEKYKNNFSYFLKTFAKKGAVKQKREEQGLAGEDPHKLNAYSDYLVVAYRAGLKELEDNFNREKIVKIKTDLDYYANCFKKHFNKEISKFV
jgi:hypothetical protein